MAVADNGSSVAGVAAIVKNDGIVYSTMIQTTLYNTVAHIEPGPLL